jgi:hypothetical protein
MALLEPVTEPAMRLRQAARIGDDDEFPRGLGAEHGRCGKEPRGEAEGMTTGDGHGNLLETEPLSAARPAGTH